MLSLLQGDISYHSLQLATDMRSGLVGLVRSCN